MKILQVFNGYVDQNLYGCVVRSQSGTKTFSSYVNLLRNSDVLNSAIETTDESSELPVQIPAAFRNQIYKAAVEYKNSGVPANA